MSKADDLMKLSPVIYQESMRICEDAMQDDNELEMLARHICKNFEGFVKKQYNYVE